MWISQLSARGFAGEDRDHPEGPLEQVEQGVEPRRIDALALLAGALDVTRREAIATWMGWSGAWTEEELALPRPIQEAAPAPHPALVVEAQIRPDPPLFGRIREGLMRDPERALGLADGTLTVRIGWQLTSDRRVIRPDLLGVRLGELPLPLTELPAWVLPVLHTVGRRIRLVDPAEPLGELAGRLGRALLGDDPEARVAARRALTVAAVELVQTGADWRLVLQDSLQPLRWGPPTLEDRVRLAEAALLGRPDVLVVPWRVDGPTSGWLASLLEGDDAVLEQVVLR